MLSEFQSLNCWSNFNFEIQFFYFKFFSIHIFDFLNFLSSDLFWKNRILFKCFRVHWWISTNDWPFMVSHQFFELNHWISLTFHNSLRLSHLDDVVPTVRYLTFANLVKVRFLTDGTGCCSNGKAVKSCGMWERAMLEFESCVSWVCERDCEFSHRAPSEKLPDHFTFLTWYEFLNFHICLSSLFFLNKWTTDFLYYWNLNFGFLMFFFWYELQILQCFSGQQRRGEKLIEKVDILCRCFVMRENNRDFLRLEILEKEFQHGTVHSPCVKIRDPHHSPTGPVDDGDIQAPASTVDFFLEHTENTHVSSQRKINKTTLNHSR